MSTIQLTNVRVGTDVIMNVRLMNDGVAIDWSQMTGVYAYVYSDAQRVMAGRCTTRIDEEDPTLMAVTFSANSKQCLGVNRLVVSCLAGASNVTYDAPAFAYVATLAEASDTTEVEAAEVNISLSVTSRTSTVLEELVAACIAATRDASEAAESANGAATSANAAANAASSAASDASTAATAANTAAAAFASAIVQTTGQATDKVMSQKAVTDELAGVVHKTGDEDVSGQKNFEDGILIEGELLVARFGDDGDGMRTDADLFLSSTNRHIRLHDYDRDADEERGIDDLIGTIFSKADSSNVYTKTQVDDLLSDVAHGGDLQDLEDYVNRDFAKKADTYTKTEVDGKLAEKANQSTTYTKSAVDGKLSAKANTTDLTALSGRVDGIEAVIGDINGRLTAIVG